MPPQSRKSRRTWWALAVVSALLVGFACELTQAFCGSDESTPGPVDANRLEAHVRMLAETLAPRDFRHAQNLDAAASYITDELRKLGLHPFDQRYEVAGRSYRNVRVIIGAPESERVIVGAHYDACDALPAADDNASGVAVLLELAASLARTPPRGTVELVAYTLEEPPHFATSAMGSVDHAVSLRREGVRVRGMLSLEMLGYFSDEPGSQHYPAPLLGWLYPSRGDFVAIVGRFGGERIVRTVKRAMTGATKLPIRAMVTSRSIPGVDYSDHASYWAEGYEAALVTDTAFLRNRNYHTAADRPDTLDYQRMALATAALHSAVLALAR